MKLLNGPTRLHSGLDVERYDESVIRAQNRTQGPAWGTHDHVAGNIFLSPPVSATHSALTDYPHGVIR